MADTALVFSQPPITAQPVDLVFGDTGDITTPPLVTATLNAQLPQPALSIAIAAGQVTTATLQGLLPDTPLAIAVDALYVSNTTRPTVGKTSPLWQAGGQVQTGARQASQNATPTPATARPAWQRGQTLNARTAPTYADAVRLGQHTRQAHQNGQGLPTTPLLGIYSDALRGNRLLLAAHHQNAEGLLTPVTSLLHQNALRGSRTTVGSAWQNGQHLSIARVSTQGKANALVKPWRVAHQNAMRPPPGLRPVIPPPPGEVCYTPSALLVFADGFAIDANLLFVCERHGTTPGTTIVVPTKRTYMLINTLTLQLVSNGAPLPALGFSMSLDADSWTWSFTATLPATALSAVTPANSNEPVEINAIVNGTTYRLCVESISRQKQFAQSAIAVKGRGRAALLDAPYAPTLNFGNATQRTAQQLMGDVLSINGVGIGWDIDWGLTDWLVPAGVWSYQGLYIGAVVDIAQAAGGYVQPHNTASTLRILPRYPAAPWDWAGLTPDIELPAAAVTVEAIEWLNKPAYNRVYVSGTSAGVLGQVTRAGTAGDSAAPMVTHPLITELEAARQRGLSVLADTGSQAKVTLELPVLSEIGLIKPGQLVRYVDGATTRTGLVRSTALQWQRPSMRQTISLETHI